LKPGTIILLAMAALAASIIAFQRYADKQSNQPVPAQRFGMKRAARAPEPKPAPEETRAGEQDEKPAPATRTEEPFRVDIGSLKKGSGNLGAISAKLRDEEFKEASEMLESEIRANPDPGLEKMLGYAYYRMRDYGSARVHLEKVAGTMAEDPDLRRMLAESLYMLNDLPGAKAELEKYLKSKPSDAQAEKLMAKIAREEKAESGFTAKKGSHFDVVYEGMKNTELGYLVSAILEDAYLKVGSDLGLFPEDVMTAVLYGEAQFRDVTLTPDWIGGIYDGKIRIPAGGSIEREKLRKIAYHEYTHALVHRIASGRCPTWLNEGLAQYEDGTDARAIKEAVVRNGGGIPSIRGLGRDFMSLGKEDSLAAYYVSLSFTSYLVTRYSLTYVRELLAECAKTADAEAAFSKVFTLPMEEIERDWAKKE
jgi:tetratricopeptide (TPR) repeat protein